jgi:hypothetical protein
VRLVADGALVRVEVRDSGGGCVEVAARQGVEEVGGRGLLLVQALGDDFGITLHEPGKTVWLAFKTGFAVEAAG